MQPLTDEIKETLLQQPGVQEWYDYFQSSPWVKPGTADRYLAVMAKPPDATKTREEVRQSLQQKDNIQMLILSAFTDATSTLNFAQVRDYFIETGSELNPKTVSSALHKLANLGLLVREGSPKRARYRLPCPHEVLFHPQLVAQTVNTHNILDLLQRPNAELRPSQIAQRLDLSISTVFNHLKQLELEGKVVRRPSKEFKGNVWRANHATVSSPAQSV